MNGKSVLIGFAALTLCASAELRAGEQAQEAAWDMLSAKPEVVSAWQDMRFGMFVCWGPVAMTGQEIGWSRGAPRGH